MVYFQICNILIPSLWARLNAEKSYGQKTSQKIDFTGVEIVWVDMKSNEYRFFIYKIDQRKKLNTLSDFENQKPTHIGAAHAFFKN